jgi:hypothetical protein
MVHMRKIFYAGGHVLTGDRTCKAVLRLARALANNDRADIVDIPVINEGGSVVIAHLLIGPASQLYSVPIENSRDEPFDSDVIEELERRTLELQPNRPVWGMEMTDVPDLDEFENAS